MTPGWFHEAWFAQGWFLESWWPLFGISEQSAIRRFFVAAKSLVFFAHKTLRFEVKP